MSKLPQPAVAVSPGEGMAGRWHGRSQDPAVSQGCACSSRLRPVLRRAGSPGGSRAPCPALPCLHAVPAPGTAFCTLLSASSDLGKHAAGAYS